MNKYLLTLLLAFVYSSGTAQKPQPCGLPEAHAFDFWIGDWKINEQILEEDGSWISLNASTHVIPELNGCALLEKWEGEVMFFWEGMKHPESMKGMSIRSYDPQSEKWSIYWMDSRHPVFGVPYTGNFKSNKGEFYRTWETPQGMREGRITFNKTGKDSVKWKLAVSRDEGKNWTTLWIMDMQRRRK